ncbi:MAG: hypothetical protein A2521_15175 [Deltaproteobacteria bacterium RIFOXYD12_FULL_57_12]|nr:MAG: hypothetical protein A2521_15175 [Deltaproteobacteria bacterium RIFOXYD12_FULL_57_12]
MGWLAGLIPLPVFYYLVFFGKKEGGILIISAILFATGAAFLAGGLYTLLFSLTMLPAGVAFWRAARTGLSPARAGLHGVLLIGVTWLLYWGAIGVANQVNPYQEVVTAIDQGLTELDAQYREIYKLPADKARELNKALGEMRQNLPQLLPALLVNGIIYTVWINLALGNWLLRKKQLAPWPWPAYSEWRLPDNFVWIGIASGITLLLANGVIAVASKNVLLVWGAVYVLQGAAVLVNLLIRWSIVQPLRVAIYGLLIIQGYGIICLAALGLSDVWVDFRTRIASLEKQKER